jgi:GDP-L-fucose synthase
MLTNARIFIAGHRGLVGSAVVRKLVALEYTNILTSSRSETDLRDRDAVHRYFTEQRPEYVVLAAARVGGILANETYPVDFLLDNLEIETNIFRAAHKIGVEKMVFLGSSCIYPRLCPQPIKEEYLLTGPLEPTNEWYAIAKIAGIKMAQAYRRQYGFRAISLMPTNLYGPGDNFDLKSSHVLPALIRKFHEAMQNGDQEVVIWGTGTPRREFLHVDDLAEGVHFALLHYDDGEILNVGTGTDVTIAELAGIVARTTGFRGSLTFDTSKPDGTPRKLLNVSRFGNLGWSAKIGLEAGIRQTYAWYLQTLDNR